MRQCVICLIFGLFGVGVALGQANDRQRYQSDVFNANSSIDNQLIEAIWKSGSWFFVPKWYLQQLGYNSNLFSSETNQVSDYSVEPGLGVAMYYRPNARFIWKNELRGSYAYFLDTESLRGFHYLGETRMYFLRRSFNFDLGARFSRDQVRLNSEVDTPSFNKNSVYDLNTVIEIGTKGSLKGRAYFRQLDFDRDEENFDPLYSELERDELSASLTYLLKLRPQFWPYAQVNVLKGFFSSENNRRDNSTLSSAYFGVRNQFLRRTHFNLRAGITAIEFPNDPEADSEKFDLRGFFTRKINRRFSVDASVLQTPIYSVYESFNFYLSQRVTLGSLYETRSQWGFGPILTAGSNRYSLVPGLSIQRRKDDWSEYGFRVKFPGKILNELSINFSYYDRRSNIQGLSDDGFQIYTSLDSTNF